MSEQWNPAEGLVDHAELAALIDSGVERLRAAMSEGYEGDGFSLPVLDPYRSERYLSKPFSYSSWLGLLSGRFELALNRLRLEGLSSLTVSGLPRVHIQERRLTFTLSFERLRLSSEEFSLRGDHRVLFFPWRVAKEGGLELTAGQVALHFSFGIGVEGENPVVKVGESRCDIGRIDLDIEGIYLLDRLLPLFRSTIEETLSERMVDALGGVINEKLRGLAASQHDLVARMRRLIELKKAQGFDVDGDGTPDRPRVFEGFGGVGQFPLPLFWQLPTVDVQGSPHISVEELLKEARTGDVLLFSGSHASSQGIRRATQSCFSHVVVVVREDDIADGRPCVFQAITSEYRGVLRGGEYKAGLQLNFLDEALEDYRSHDDHAVICWRRLKRERREETVEQEAWTALKAFIEKIDGSPYTDDMEGLYIMGLMEIDNPADADYFCAGLVAESLMLLGLLKRTFHQYQYAPRDFSERQQALPFVEETTSFDEEYVVEA